MGKPLAVIFLVDALGWEIVRRFEFAPALDAAREPLGTVLGYSSAAIPSLLSGTKPEEHGSWSMFRLAGDDATFRHFRNIPKLPQALEWRARQWVRRLVDRRGEIGNYYDLYEIPLEILGRFDLGLRTDPYRPGGLARETIFDRFVADGVKYRVWYHTTPEGRNFDEAVGAVGGDEDVLFVYTAELDALMHRVGIFEDAVGAKLASYERFIERLFDACTDRGRPLKLYLLSDHGMTDVTDSVDVWGRLERAGHRLGRDYLAFYDSTMARLWCEDRVLEDAVRGLGGAGRLLGEEDLRSYGCHFPGLEYGRHILLANPGVMIVPSFMGSQRIAAMHGYEPEDAYSIGCFLSNDPEGAIPRSVLDFKDYIVARVNEVRR